MSFTLLKLFVLSLSVILEVLGLILIAYGIIFLNTVTTAENISGGVFIILGFVIMIIAIFGFLAAICEAPVTLLIYVGVLILMIRIQVVLIGLVSHIKDDINEEIRKASAFNWMWKTDPAPISGLREWINWLQALKIVCWLLIVAEVVGAISACMLSRSIRNLRARWLVPRDLP